MKVFVILIFGLLISFSTSVSEVFASMCNDKRLIDEKGPGMYFKTVCGGKACFQKVKRFRNKVDGEKLELFLISGKSTTANRLAVFQYTHRDLTTEEFPENTKPGRFVNIARDRIDFICGGKNDNSVLASGGLSFAVPADEYDSYHRFFSIRDDDLGPILRRQFHAEIEHSEDSCIRTDDVSTRFLFLLGERMLKRGRFAEFLRRVGLSSSSAFASPRASEFSKVQVRVKKTGSKEFACFASDVNMLGERLKVEATDIQESIARKVLRPEGVFFEGNFVRSSN